MKRFVSLVSTQVEQVGQAAPSPGVITNVAVGPFKTKVRRVKKAKHVRRGEVRTVGSDSDAWMRKMKSDPF